MHRLAEWLQSDHLVQNCMMTENGKYPLVYIPGFLCKGRQHNNKGRRPKRTTCLQRLQKNEHLTEY
mgnify:FL=1